ncbi:hypothetical protein AB0M20_00595 [Actinoplanes sp. NPDC051633]|uniref:hypothetical protein n=1 Tax=Actinoplanes sp. NPDC051633 TaxID=3155670 RepID=UPI00344A0DE4
MSIRAALLLLKLSVAIVFAAYATALAVLARIYPPRRRSPASGIAFAATPTLAIAVIGLACAVRALPIVAQAVPKLVYRPLSLRRNFEQILCRACSYGLGRARRRAPRRGERIGAAGGTL